MKKLTISIAHTVFLALALATTSGRAQAPATPPAPTGTGTGATTSTGAVTTTSVAAKPKPLGEPEKRFFKEVSEAILFEQKLATIGSKATVGEESKKAFNTVNNELKRVWEKFATLSMEKGATISQEVSKSDASKAERIGKLKEDKLEKELIEDLGKETKKTSRLFDSKTLQDPVLKKFADDWGPTIKGHEGTIDKAEKALGKKPK